MQSCDLTHWLLCSHVILLLPLQSSLSVIVQELEFGVSVVLDVVREGGVFGEVRVAWEVSGEHIEGEVTPTSGEVG